MIVAFSGFKGSGKDECVNYLNKKYGFQKISFAGPLKDRVSSDFGFPREWLDDPNFKEMPLPNYPTPAADGFTKMISEFMVREFRTAGGCKADIPHIRVENGVLQTFINGWENLYHTPRSLAILVGSSMRAGDPSFWVRKSVNQMVEAAHHGFFSFAISDLRYKSEMKQLRERFGKDLITIRINRFDSSPSTDPSELDLIDHPHDFVVTNKGTKEELFAKIDEILNVWA